MRSIPKRPCDLFRMSWGRSARTTIFGLCRLRNAESMTSWNSMLWSFAPALKHERPNFLSNSAGIKLFMPTEEPSIRTSSFPERSMWFIFM